MTRTQSGESNTDLAAAKLAATRARLLKAKPRRIVEGKKVGKCVECGGDLVETSSLEKHFILPGREIVVGNLTGEKCLACGAELLDAHSIGRLIPYRDQQILASYTAKITRVGGKSLGTYIPHDLAESLGLSGGAGARFFILDENHILIRIERGKQKATA
jgi:YgiT-type zinc finger domain-containing protein